MSDALLSLMDKGSDKWVDLHGARNEYQEHFFPEGGIVGEEPKVNVSHDDGGFEV